LQQEGSVAALKDPRGLYSYCWCREPLSPLKAVQAR